MQEKHLSEVLGLLWAYATLPERREETRRENWFAVHFGCSEGQENPMCLRFASRPFKGENPNIHLWEAGMDHLQRYSPITLPPLERIEGYADAVERCRRQKEGMKRKNTSESSSFACLEEYAEESAKVAELDRRGLTDGLLSALWEFDEKGYRRAGLPPISSFSAVESRLESSSALPSLGGEKPVDDCHTDDFSKLRLGEKDFVLTNRQNQARALMRTLWPTLKQGIRSKEQLADAAETDAGRFRPDRILGKVGLWAYVEERDGGYRLLRHPKSA